MNRSLEFTLKISPCLGCSVCPQPKLNAAYTSPKTTMTLEDFNTILNKLPKTCRVDFSGMSEAFLNPHACDMVGTAVAKGYEVHLYTTLVGLKSGCVDVLKNYRPHFVKIHIPDGKLLVFDDGKWIALHELFLLAKIPASYMSMSDPTDTMKRYLAIKKIAPELPQMLSRGGNVQSITVKPKFGPIRCAANKFHNNIVLPSGDVYVCCMDWNLSMPVGNLLVQPYSEIESAASRYEANQNPPENSICRSCEWSAPV